ncbi:MAG: helix-turn-helix domain-containing protein [Solirubrobacteraceae bacterium]
MNTKPTQLPGAADPDRPRLTGADVLDGREVAATLHLPVSTVLDYARRGVLPGRKLGRRWIFLRDELEAVARAVPRALDRLDPGTTSLTTDAKATLKRYPRAVPSAQDTRRARVSA